MVPASMVASIPERVGSSACTWIVPATFRKTPLAELAPSTETVNPTVVVAGSMVQTAAAEAGAARARPIAASAPADKNRGPTTPSRSL